MYIAPDVLGFTYLRAPSPFQSHTAELRDLDTTLIDRTSSLTIDEGCHYHRISHGLVLLRDI